MAKSISGLLAITSLIRANYALAVESLTNPLEDTKRFGLDLVAGKNVEKINFVGPRNRRDLKTF